MHSESGTLFIVATPIGNLADATSRSLDILKSVDFILAEDTRVTLKLLSHFGISGKRLYSYSEHSSEAKEQTIIEHLLNGESAALVSDAGTPAVSDPGARLIDKVLAAEIPVVPIPGPSAVTALVSVFGKPANAFHFWGFFPMKKIRQTELLAMFESCPGIHVFFESPFRILKILEGAFSGRDDFDMVLGRELTKKFETILRGTPSEVLAQLKADTIKGEFVVGVMKKNPKERL